MNSKQFLVFAIVMLFVALVMIPRTCERYYEQGVYDGSVYTLERGYLPSIWHREFMFSVRNYKWREQQNVKQYWDSIDLLYLNR
jgi:uncharacterized membrane protein